MSILFVAIIVLVLILSRNGSAGAVGKQKVLLVHNYKHYFFDPLDAANSVTVEGKVPNLWGPGCGRAGGIVICAGSSLPGNNASSITRIYNIGSNSWSNGPNLNSARWLPSNGHLAEINNRYVIACGSSGLEVHTCEMLDIQETPMTWQYLPDIPSDVYTKQAATAGYGQDWMIITGGRRSGVLSSGTNAYNIRTRVWRTLANMPDEREAHAMAVFGGSQIIVCGGFNSDTAHRTINIQDDCFRLDNLNNALSGSGAEWRTDVARMPVINNVLYALGGQFREMTDVRNTVFVWSRDLRTCNRSARVIPEAMDGMGYAVIPA